MAAHPRWIKICTLEECTHAGDPSDAFRIKLKPDSHWTSFAETPDLNCFKGSNGDALGGGVVTV
jgi:hypothetical protein